MAIVLLEKYHAYAPPFKYEPLTGEPYIGGVEGRVAFNEDLLNQLKKAWEAEMHGEHKEWRIPSAHQVGLFYTVVKAKHGFSCTCPARGRCWHIKVAQRLDLDDTCDVMEAVKRVNDYQGDI